MNGVVQIFNNPQFGEVRINNDNGKPLFMASDVARALGYSRPADAVSSHCKGVVVLPTPTTGGVQSVKFIPESDVYRLVMRSKLPTAEIFQDWVMDEVLPAIRNHGVYMTPQKIEEVLANPDLIIGLATQLKEERQRAEILANDVVQLGARTLEQEKALEAAAPKVLFADAVTTSQNSILIRELATILRQKGIDIGEKRLFAWMREHEYLCSRGESRNLPTQRATEMGLITIKESARVAPNGTVFVDLTPKITGKGQTYFIQKFFFNKK